MVQQQAQPERALVLTASDGIGGHLYSAGLVTRTCCFNSSHIDTASHHRATTDVTLSWRSQHPRLRQREFLRFLFHIRSRLCSRC
jgi:hypothetical protein